MHKLEIRKLQPLRVITLTHRGSYMLISRAFEQLGNWLAARDLLKPQTRMVAIYYHDPSVVPEADLRSKAGFVIPDLTIESPFERTEIRGGDYAVMAHKGPYEGLPAAYQWLYEQWLPTSGRRAANAPAFEEYLNTPANSSPEDLLTDICIPLE